MIPQKKKIAFSIITVLLFIGILIIVEFVLRITFPSLDNPFVRETTADGTASFEINRKYLTRYFPSDSRILPELKPSLFRKNKSQHMFRVVCLGGSSMLGTPYQLNANIPGVVRRQLRHLYPEKEIEVINLGAAAINSNVILDLAKTMIDFQPNLVLLYMGHNEFYGPDGVGAAFVQKEFPATIPMKYTANDWRLVKLIDAYAMPSANERGTSEQNLMKQVSRENAVPLKSEDAERIFRRFESNVRGIISLFKKNNIPLIVSDISSNLTFPPFLYDTSVQLAPYQHEFSLIDSEFKEKKYNSALERALHLVQIDSSNAFINFMLGKIYLAAEQPLNAKKYLRRARDEDLLKFRAPSRINTILTSVSSELDIPFVSSDSLFCSISQFGIPGEGVFREHLHPNARGYYEIATLFVKKILDLRLISQRAITHPPLAFHYDSLFIPWLDLAYGDISIRQLTKQWPFQHYNPQMFVINSSDKILLSTALEVYSQKISLTEGCYKTAGRFQQLGEFRDAVTTYAYLSEEYPQNYYPYYLSGTIYKEMGNMAKAIEQYEKSLRYNPSYLYSLIDLGLLKINDGKFDEAISLFQAAEHLANKEKSSPLVKATIYYGLSAAYANKNDFTQALYFIGNSLRLAPDYEAAQELSRQLHSLQ